MNHTATRQMPLAGLTWTETRTDHWAAQDARLEYVVFQDDDQRWTGYILRDGEKVSPDYTCPSLETIAEHLVGSARRRAMMSVAVG